MAGKSQEACRSSQYTCPEPSQQDWPVAWRKVVWALVLDAWEFQDVGSRALNQMWAPVRQDPVLHRLAPVMPALAGHTGGERLSESGHQWILLDVWPWTSGSVLPLCTLCPHSLLWSASPTSIPLAIHMYKLGNAPCFSQLVPERPATSKE